MNRKRRIILGGITGAVVMASLLLINHSDTTPITTDENTITETEQQPEPVPTPDPQPTPTPTPSPAPDPQPGVLPADWDSLTPREKTNLNPFNCDHEIQWVAAEDGTCINKAPDVTKVGAELLLDLGFSRCEPANYLWDNYIDDLAERYDVSIEELKEQIDAADLPAVLADTCFYSDNNQVDHQLLVIHQNAMDKLDDFVIMHNYYNLLFSTGWLPPGYGWDWPEHIAYADYRYTITDQSQWDQWQCYYGPASSPAPPTATMAMLMQLLDDNGHDDYQYKGGYTTCHY